MPGTARDVVLSLVVPVYNEEKAVPLFLERVVPILRRITEAFEILFVLDPCRDRTQAVIEEAIAREPRVRLLVMTRRWGQNACMIAGFEHCRGQACIITDVDLQDPPELMLDMVAKWREGYQVVYAQRRRRAGDPWPRRVVAFCGYWVINRISQVPIPRDTGDYRLLDRRVIEGLRQLQETHGFLRGLVPYVGYRQTLIQYDREERKAGASKYSAWVGSLRHGVDGLVAFSIQPLTLISILGAAVLGVSILLLVGYGCGRWSGGTGSAWCTPGTIIITGLSGLQLLALGVVGEYIGRIYEEARRRPKYMVAQRINFPEESDETRCGT